MIMVMVIVMSMVMVILMSMVMVVVTMTMTTMMATRIVMAVEVRGSIWSHQWRSRHCS